jgi:hypothetical protein
MVLTQNWPNFAQYSLFTTVEFSFCCGAYYAIDYEYV